VNRLQCFFYRGWLWYYHNFLCGFCYSWPLLLLLLLPFALMLGVLLAGYGSRTLFFHDEPLKGLIAGVTVIVYWAQVLVIAYLVWLRDLREGRLAPAAPAEPASPFWFYLAWLRGEGRGGECDPGLRDTLRPLGFRQFVVRVGASLLVTGGFGWAIIELGGMLLRVIPVVSVQKLTAALSQTPESEDAAPPDSQLLQGLAFWGGFLLAAVVLYCLGTWLQPWVARQSGRVLDWARRPAGEAVPRWLWWCGFILFPLSLVGAWGWLTWMFLTDATTGWHYWGPLAATGLGLLATAGAYVSAAELRRRAAAGGGLRPLYGGLFWPAAFANFCLSYAVVSCSVSWSAGGILTGLAAAVGCAFVLGVCLRALFPQRWTGAWRAFARALEPMLVREREHVVWGLLCLALPVALLLLMLWPAIASPLPLGLCVLSGMVAVYGFFTYVVRRHFVLLVGLLFLLVLFSHLQPYKMRFGDLGEYYAADDDSIADLQEIIAGERDRQRKFDQSLQEYAAVLPSIVGLQETVDRGGEEAPEGAAQALAVLKSWAGRREQELKTAWAEMERQNRVRAARLSPTFAAALPPPLKRTLGFEGRPEIGLLRPEVLEVHPAAQLAVREGQKPDLIVIAVSGGGIRAAVWTFVVLAELEKAFAEKGIDFPAHVRLITGASGGMVGAAYYVATLPHPDQRPPTLPGPEALANRAAVLEEQRGRLSSDFLTRLVSRAVLSDIPGWLSPWVLEHDRGRALEQAWREYLKDPADPCGHGALEQTFWELRDGEREGWRPSLVFTPMLIEDGRRALISNLDLREPISNDGRVQTSQDSTFPDNHSFEALELFRLFPRRGDRAGAQEKLRLATAARMSASFPYFSPAVSLPTRPRRRVVDAGYYDNYGVGLAASWLFSNSSQEWVRRNFDRILFVQIRDGLTEQERQLEKLPEYETSSLTRSAEELTSPPEGLYNAGFASSSFRNDGQLELLEKFDGLSRDRARLEQYFRRFSTDPRRLKRQLDALRRASEGLAGQAAAAQGLVAPPAGGPGLPLAALALGLLPTRAEPPLPDDFESAALAARTILRGNASVRENWDANFLVANFELDQPASTSWYLTNKEKKAITLKAAGKLKAKISRILDTWWLAPGQR
jgi:hypothetical protein